MHVLSAQESQGRSDESVFVVGGGPLPLGKSAPHESNYNTLTVALKITKPNIPHNRIIKNGSIFAVLLRSVTSLLLILFLEIVPRSGHLG